MRRCIAIAVGILLLPSFAEAHSFARYVSTPVTPPLELLWVLPIYAVLFIVGNALFRRRAFGSGFIRSVLVALAFFVCFAGSFFFVGAFYAGMSTAPPPGLGMPHPTFWGFTWDDAGGLYLIWNLLGVIMLAGWSRVFLAPGSSPSRRRTAAVIGNLALYMVCLLPYVVSGAWLHGWAGGYVHDGCRLRLEALNMALIEYADSHDGRFPTADGLEPLLETLEPYIDQDHFWFSMPVDVCPIGGAYEHRPKHYEWDPSFSGINLRDIDPEQLFDGKVPLACPYHRRTEIDAALTLTDAIWDAEENEGLNKPDAGDAG